MSFHFLCHVSARVFFLPLPGTLLYETFCLPSTEVAALKVKKVKGRKKSDVHVLIILIQSKLVACTSPSASCFPIPRDTMAIEENSCNFNIASPEESKPGAKWRSNRWVTTYLGDCALSALQLVLQDCYRCPEWHRRQTVSVPSLESWKRTLLKKSFLSSVYLVDPKMFIHKTG